MGFKQNDPNTRRQVARFSVNEWIDFRARLMQLNESAQLTKRNFKILYELIFNQKTTAQLAYLAKTDESYSWLKSNQNKPMSCRRIQQILTDYFPEFHIQTTNAKSEEERARLKIRNELLQSKRTAYKDYHKCGRCGSEKRLELHHLFPVVLGGTNDDRNLIWLCHDCHKIQSVYFLERLRQMKKGDDNHRT